MSDIADFIDRNEFMRLIQEAYQAAAEKAGTYCKDLVPVVRCKDCEFGEDHEPGMVWCPKVIGSWMSENGYCSEAKRRKDNG